MNFKKKALGLVAATTLSLSLASGAMAETTNVGVTLKGDPCSLTITSGTDINFGTWKWNGSNKYELETGGTSGYMQGTIKNHEPNGECKVTVSSAGLEGQAWHAIIPASHLSGSVNGIGTATLDTSISGNVGPGTFEGSLELTGIANLDVQPDTYAGTVDFTIQNGD